MRFLLLTQYFRPEIGAVPVRLWAMTTELRRQGHEVEIVTGMPNYPEGKIAKGYRGRVYMREEIDGVRVHRVWMYAASGSGMKRILNYASFTAMALFGLIRARRPDYLFVESPPPTVAVPAWVAAKLWRTKWIINFADPWLEAAREMGIIKDGFVLRSAERLELWSFRSANFVNAVTEGLRTTLLEKKKLPPEKVLFLPNAVDLELFKPRPRDEALARELGVEGKRLVLYTGVLGIPQGLHQIVDAFALLRETNPDAMMLFVGAGSSEAELREYAAAKSPDNIRFLGAQPVEKVAALYSLASIGLTTMRDLPLFECWRPAKLMPIMASGTPAMYCGRGEGVRLIETAGAGVALPPEQPAILAEAIRSLLADPDRAAAYARAGRKYAEEFLGWKAVLTDWLQHLQA